jgi:APA family basic amino acid/polyamine antiporter
VAAIGILIFGLLSSSKGSAANMTHTSFTPEGMALLGAYMSAIGGAFWAYDGWNNITFIAGEIQRPRENIPKSLFTGLLTCILVYATLNLAFIYILPIETLAASSFVASDAATIVWGVTGGTLITIMVVLSTLGTTNSNVLATARVTCAWSRDNRLFNGAAKVHRGNFTPGNALLLNAIWSCILILSGSFDMLTSMLVFVSWFFYMMSGIGLFVLRRKMPAEERAYKVWGYPLIPAIFIVFAAAFLIITLYTDITAYIGGRSDFINSVFGICITLTGIPFYFISRKRKLHIDSSAGERGKQVN